VTIDVEPKFGIEYFDKKAKQLLESYLRQSLRPEIDKLLARTAREIEGK
jgi:hypothetical protein